MADIKTAIDADRVKLFPKSKQKTYQRQCHEWDGGMNDAELVAEMRRSGDLTKVEIPAMPSVRAAQGRHPEVSEGLGFKAGDSVTVTLYWPWGPETVRRRIAGIIPAARSVRLTNGEVWPVRLIRHA